MDEDIICEIKLNINCQLCNGLFIDKYCPCTFVKKEEKVFQPKSSNEIVEDVLDDGGGGLFLDKGSGDY